MYNIQYKKYFIFSFLFFCLNSVSYSEPLPIFEKRIFTYPSNLNIELVTKNMSNGKINYELIIKNINLGSGLEHLNVLRWVFLTENPNEAQRLAENIIQKFFTFYKNLTKFKKTLLLNGISQSETNLKIDEKGIYHENENKKKYLTVEKAYHYFENENSGQKNYLRISIEVACVLGFGGTWYFLTRDTQSKDWDLDWNTRDLKRKFKLGDGIAFDRNDEFVNYVLHPLKGIMVYSTARSNHLNPLESLLFNLVGSFTWEYLIEFREKVSINDMIVTPIAGSIIGEVFYQFGDFFYKSHAHQKTRFNKIFSFIFARPQKFHDWLDNNTPKALGESDVYGFPKNIHHEFESKWIIKHAESSEAIGFHWKGELIKTEEYEKEGDEVKTFLEPLYNDTELKLLLGEKNFKEFLFFARTTYLGVYRHHLKRKAATGGDDFGALNGWNGMLGLGSAYTHELHNNSYHKDWFANVHILGARAECVFYHNGLRVRMLVDEYGDFSAIRSLAVDQYYTENGNTLSGSKDVLDKERYYYAWGSTSSGKILVSMGKLEFGAELKQHLFDSIEGYSRFQKEKVTDDFNLQDKRTGFEIWGSYFLTKNSFIQAGSTRRENFGKIKHIEIDKKFQEYYFSFGQRF